MITIAWKVSYMGEVDYEVFGDGTPYRVSVRFEAGTYFRSIYNGSQEQWDREVVASVGLAHRQCSEMVKPEVLAALQAYIGESPRSGLAIDTGYFDHNPNVKAWVHMPEGYQYIPDAGHASFEKYYHCYMDPVKGWCCDPIPEVAACQAT